MSDAQPNRFSIRFLNKDGFRESPWVQLAPGVTVLTGRNNVGKSRILRTISNLASVFDGRASLTVPEILLVGEGYELEVDINGPTPPTRWFAKRAGQADFEVNWTRESNGNWALVNTRQPDLRLVMVGQPGPAYAAQAGGSLALFAELQAALASTVYFQPQRVPEMVANTSPVSVPSPDAGDLGRVIYHHRGHETPAMGQMDRLMSAMFPEIDRVLAGPSGANQVTISVHDRFADRNVPLSDVGTGLTQLLHLIASVLLMPVGRTMLIEEPTAYLHPAAERLLAAFIRDHPEHAYVISTHSPIFISALDPDRMLLVRRDANGIDISPVIGTDLTMRQVLQELGVQPGDLALSERILFVEGVADLGTYPVLLTKLGWDPAANSCALIQLQGFGSSRSVRDTMKQLSEHIYVKHLVLLDGDQRRNAAGDLPNLAFLPVPELENLFLRDPTAVSAGMAEVWAEEHSEAVPHTAAWEAAAVGNFIKTQTAKDRDAKGSKILTDLAHRLGFDYRKAVHGPAIAKHLDPKTIEDIRPLFADLFA